MADWGRLNHLSTMFAFVNLDECVPHDHSLAPQLGLSESHLQHTREIAGLDVCISEEGAFWLSFLRSLLAGGLSGVELIVSDAHLGLRDAIATVSVDRLGSADTHSRQGRRIGTIRRPPNHASPDISVVHEPATGLYINPIGRTLYHFGLMSE